MNGGAYGREVKDILVDCDVVIRSGEIATLPLSELGYTYRHSDLVDGCIVVAARFRGVPGEAQAIQAEMDRISASREASQPCVPKPGAARSRTPTARAHGNWSTAPVAGA
jgi:UDP-N-acetylmuramate dehydrogenase